MTAAQKGLLSVIATAALALNLLGAVYAFRLGAWIIGMVLAATVGVVVGILVRLISVSSRTR